MGFFFRKSESFGPFRLNASKSGLGLSGGIKGLRVSLNRRGATLFAGRSGLYYRQKLSMGDRASATGGTAEKAVMICFVLTLIVAIAFIFAVLFIVGSVR